MWRHLGIGVGKQEPTDSYIVLVELVGEGAELLKLVEFPRTVLDDDVVRNPSRGNRGGKTVFQSFLKSGGELDIVVNTFSLGIRCLNRIINPEGDSVWLKDNISQILFN